MKYLPLIALLIFTACAPVQENLSQIDESETARPAFMVERSVEVSGKPERIWERMHTRYAPATIYVGGEKKLGLDLAARDKSENVAWLPTANAKILDQIRALYDLKHIHLVVTNNMTPALFELIATYEHIMSVRFVAVDLSGFQDGAGLLAKLPQVHFVGAMDDTAAPADYHLFRQAMGPSKCVKYSVMPDASHTKGWEALWPKLLKIKPACSVETPTLPLKTEIIPIQTLKPYEK